MHKTAALILHRLKYSDNSSILRCFTQHHGTVAVFHRHSKKKPGIMEHLFYELTLDKRPGRELFNLKEANYLHDLNPGLPGANTTLWLLVNELALKTTAESIPLPEFFTLVTRLRSLLSVPQPSDRFLPVLLASVSDKLGVLDPPNLPTLDSEQAHLLSLLGITLPKTPTAGTRGSSTALLDHLRSHFDIGHVFAADLLLKP